MSIGVNIKNRRNELGLTLEEVAQNLNITRQTLSRYENNIISNIPSDRIEKIAEALKCSPAYLMGWEEVQKNNDALSDIIIRAQRNDKFFEVMKSLYSIADNRLDMAKAVIDALNQ